MKNIYKVNEEAVKKIAERVYDNGSTVINRNDLEEMFPELAESKDERIKKAIVWCIDTIQGELGINEPEGLPISELKSWLEKQGEQKPLFPNNEVRDIWEYLYKFKTLYGHYPNDADEIEVIVREIIKSKAEWNKRDEEILDTIISVFTHRYADDSEDEQDISSWEIVRWAEKLKSRKLKSEWKPSNEQMAVLNEVINYAANSELQHWSSFIYTLLKSLREQLKKLREE